MLWCYGVMGGGNSGSGQGAARIRGIRGIRGVRGALTLFIFQLSTQTKSFPFSAFRFPFFCIFVPKIEKQLFLWQEREDHTHLSRGWR